MATPVTQTISPWQPIASQLGFAFQEARRLYDQGPPAFYPQPTYVGFAPQTAQALAGMQRRAEAGSPLTRAAQATARATLRGDLLGDNPYLDAVYEAAARRVRDQVNATFGGAGRVGSGAHADVVSRNLGELAGGLYGQAYENERQRQLDAVRLAPSLAAADYADLDRLLSVGQAHEAQSLARVQDRVQRHNFAETADTQHLAQFLTLLSGTPFTTTQSTPPEPDSAGRALGLAGGVVDLLGGVFDLFT